MHSAVEMKVILALALSLTVVQPALADSGAAAATQRQAAFRDYRIAAGTHFEIEVRTAMSSNASRRHDAIEGRLLRSVEQDGVELVPAGAVVRGTVTEVEPAGKRQPGRLSFTFHIVEHPATGSLATMQATVVTLESPRPEKGNVYSAVEIARGRQTSVALLAPLTVRIPAKPASPSSR